MDVKQGFILKCRNTVNDPYSGFEIIKGLMYKVVFVDNERPIILITIKEINSDVVLTFSIDFIFDNFHISYY
jgi:hypothetical protein